MEVLRGQTDHLKKVGKMRERVEGLLRQLARQPGALHRGDFAEQIAALCYRPATMTEPVMVYLVTSRDTGRWIIPKGWPMKGKAGHEAAATEAWEEGGVNGKVDDKPYGYFTYMKRVDGKAATPCIVSVYLLKVTSIDKSFREKGQRSHEWMTCEEAARRVHEGELSGLFLKLKTSSVTSTPARNKKI